MLKYIPLLALALAACQTDAPAPPEASGVETAGSPLIEVENATQLVDQIIEEGNEATVLNFWATWCGPCRVEFPDLVRYDADKEGEGVEVRFVSVDLPSDGEAVQQFLDDHGVTDPSYLYAGPGELIGQLDASVAGLVPVTMVFSGDGTFIKSHLGLLTYEAIDQLVADARST